MTAGDQHLEVRIAPQRARQIGAGAGEGVAFVLAAVPVPLLVGVHREYLVANRLHIDAERLAHVRVRRHGVRRDERLDAGVELPIPGAARRHRPGDPRIETADDQAAVPQQVEEDSLIADAEVLFVYERRRESGQLRDALDDAAPRRALQPGA